MPAGNPAINKLVNYIKSSLLMVKKADALMSRNPGRNQHLKDRWIDMTNRVRIQMPPLWQPLLAVSISGFSSAVGQIVALRELFVFFYGNELSAGLIFACWLIWTAAGCAVSLKFIAQRSDTAESFIHLLAVQTLLLPVTVMLIRASRIIWAIPLGEMLSPFFMIWIACFCLSPFCLVSGALFGVAWHSQSCRLEEKPGSPIAIYLGEALGAALGGLFFYFVVIPRCLLITGTFLTGVVSITSIAVFWIARLKCQVRTRKLTVWLALLAAFYTTGTIWRNSIEHVSRRWQWGENLLTVRDSPFHNLALVKNADQYSLFSNGLWLFSVPDPLSAEYAVHLPMLQHGAPTKILLIGGGIAGLLSEVLKYTDVVRVDYVEQDFQLIELAEEFLPSAATDDLFDTRVHMHHLDAATFVRTSRETYDVIIMNLGDPVNADLNRFYTAEFFKNLARILDSVGIVSFSVSSSPDTVGPTEAMVLRSIFVTLKSVFPSVSVIPGESARFFGSKRPEILSIDPYILVERLHSRQMDLLYVREYYLFDTLNPMRMEYLREVVNKGPDVPINTDFKPTCYFNDLMVWAAQLNPALGKYLAKASQIGKTLWEVSILFVALLGYLLSRMGWLDIKKAVMINVFAIGGIQMILEVVLLLAFQILEGFVYQQLALIVAFFMAGMATGAGITAHFGARIRRPSHWLVASQISLAAYLILILQILYQLHARSENSSGSILPASIIFSIAAMLAGFLGAIQFSFATLTISEHPQHLRGNGPTLYAVDLAGATTGVLLGSLFLLPILGLTHTMLTLAALCAGGSILLIRKNR